jgi:2-methylaconitate cis-trans-isomerase PrpF
VTVSRVDGSQALASAWPQAVAVGDQLGVRVAVIRGGTSRGVYFHAADLPADDALRDRVILAVYGSPDERQIDGLGGGHPLTSKVAIVSLSTHPDADVDYLFGQVRVAEPVIDYSGICGNLLAGIGPFAVDEGLVAAAEPLTEVRIRVVNTGSFVRALVPVVDGLAQTRGDAAVAGAPGTGAGIALDFAASGATLGRGLLPTGQTCEHLELSDGRSVEVSIVDAGNATVFLRAADLAIERPALLEQPLAESVVSTMLSVRGAAAERLGLVTRATDAERLSPALPKVYAVGRACDFTARDGRRVGADEVTLVGCGLTMGRQHPAYAVTVAVCTATAARLEGTVVAEVDSRAGSVRIGHPSGVTEVRVEVSGDGTSASLASARLVRTARRISSGIAFVPAGLLEGWNA